MMDFFRVGWQRAGAVLHGFEVRFSRFRQGMGNRTPDFSEFRRKAAAFFAQFPFPNPKPTVNVQAPQAPQQALQAQRSNPPVVIAPISESSGNPFEDQTADEPRPSPAPKVIVASPEPTIESEAPLSELVEIVNTISDTASTLGDAIDKAADDIAKGAENLLGIVQQTVEEFANSATDAIARKVEELTGSPPPPPPPPPASRSERPTQPVTDRAKHDDDAELFQPASDNFEERVIPADPIPKPQLPAETVTDSMSSRPFTDDELREATRCFREDALRLEAERIKKDEAAFLEPSPRPKPVPRAIKTFDTTSRAYFRDWRDKTSPVANATAPVDASPEPPMQAAAEPGPPMQAAAEPVDPALDAEIKRIVQSLLSENVTSSPVESEELRPFGEDRKNESSDEMEPSVGGEATASEAQKPLAVPAIEMAPARNPRDAAARLKRQRRDAFLGSREDLRTKLGQVRRQPAPNIVRQVLVEGKTPPTDVFVAAMGHKLQKEKIQKERRKGRLVRTEAKSELPRAARKGAVDSAAPREPSLVRAQASAELRTSQRSAHRQQRTADDRITAWARKTPRHLGELVARDGFSLALLRTARRKGSAQLHHAAWSMIGHFKESVHGMDWQREARRVLSGETTARKLAEDKRLEHDLKMLAQHFKAYAQAHDPDELAPNDLDDLKALGEVIEHLLENADRNPTAAEVMDAALLAFSRDLKRRKPANYLQEESEGAGLARRVMKQGLQDQIDRVVAALDEVATAHAADVAILGNCRYANMTQEQSEAACRLTTALLNKAFDLEHDGADLLERFDRDALAYLDGAALLIEGRPGKEILKFEEVREFYADALVVLPLEGALKQLIGSDAPTVGIARITTGLASWLFRESEALPIVSLDAKRDLELFIQANRTQARSLLSKVRGG
jgi:hypothetical protein